MPNWCNNEITIKGTAKELKKFDEQFKKETVRYSGGEINVSADNLEAVKKDHEKYQYRITEDEYDSSIYLLSYIEKEELKAGYSFKNFVPMTKDNWLDGWYFWSCENWGTKWDLSGDDVQVSGLDLVEEALEDGEEDLEIEVIYYFDTAWSPCCPVVKAMAEQYLELEFVHFYEECGMCFAGRDAYANGELVESIETDDEEYPYKQFMHEQTGREYCKCAKCGELLEEWEYEEDWCCPECNSKRIYNYDGETLVELKDEN